MITHAQLVELLRYDPDTGHFWWRKPRRGNRSPITKPAGYTNTDGRNAGYVSIRICGKLYKAHRLAWFYVHQTWPEVVDHMNHDKGDNRISNLRGTSNKNNVRHQRIARHNTTGFKGVTKTSGDKYRAQIKVNGTPIWLGAYNTPEEAHEAYKEAAIRHFGSYAHYG